MPMIVLFTRNEISTPPVGWQPLGLQLIGPYDSPPPQCRPPKASISVDASEGEGYKKQNMVGFGLPMIASFEWNATPALL